MAGIKRTVKLARQLAEDSEILNEHVNVHVLRHYCSHLDENMTNGIKAGALRGASIACRVAVRIQRLAEKRRRKLVASRESEPLALAYMSLAAAHRLLESYHHAETCLDLAARHAPAGLNGEVYRRRAILSMYMHRRDDALRSSRKAVYHTSGEMRVRALSTFATVLHDSGLLRTAIHVQKLCLQRTDLKHPRFPLRLHNHLTMLANGSPEDVRSALQVYRRLRRQVPEKSRLLKAKMWWAIGLLHHRVGEEDEAWRCLEIALGSLRHLGLEPLIAAVVADMAMVAMHLPLKVSTLCRDVLQEITDEDMRVPLRALASTSDISGSAAALRSLAERQGKVVPSFFGRLPNATRH